MDPADAEAMGVFEAAVRARAHDGQLILAALGAQVAGVSDPVAECAEPPASKSQGFQEESEALNRQNP